MSTFAQNHVQQLFIGGTADKTASGTLSDANAGEICILSPSGQILTEATAAGVSAFKVGLNRGTEPDLVSDIIETAKVKSFGLKTYTAATEQIDYIGFNGTSGSIEANNNELYYVRLYLEDLHNRSSSDGRRIKFGAYNSTASATQEAIARGITDSLIRNMSREAERQIKFERICDVAGSANTGAGAATVTYDSKYVEFATDADAQLTVGDFVRLGGTAVTDPVYEVVAIDTANDIVTLDIPFQGESGSIAEADTEVIANADALAADWGIKLTGLPLDFKLGKIKYKKSRWETQVDTTEGFNQTPITKAQAASPGTGVVEIVKELEWFTQGHEGEFFRMGEPNIYDARQDADSNVAGGGYDLIDVMFVNDEVLGIGSHVSSHKHVTLAIPATAPNYAVTGTDDDITDVLEVLLAGSADGSLAVS